jgi:hypothetical protein
VGVPVEISFRTLMRYADARDADGDALSIRIASVSGGILLYDGVQVGTDFAFDPGMRVTFIANHGDYGPRQVLTIAISDGQAESLTLAPVKMVVSRPPLEAQSLPGRRLDTAWTGPATLPELRTLATFGVLSAAPAPTPVGDSEASDWWRTAPSPGPQADWNPAMDGLAATWRIGDDWRL